MRLSTRGPSFVSLQDPIIFAHQAPEVVEAPFAQLDVAWHIRLHQTTAVLHYPWLDENGSHAETAILPVMVEAVIDSARVGEAEQILKLQYLCYQSEAEVYNDWTIQPLTQSLWELLTEYDSQTILVARLGAEVVGSVRGRLEADTCHIGKLIVHPRCQGVGLGTRLMAAIEEHFDGTQRYELFTGHLSEGNLRLYRRLGYQEFYKEDVTPGLAMIHLRKSRTSNGPEP